MNFEYCCGQTFGLSSVLADPAREKTVRSELDLRTTA